MRRGRDEELKVQEGKLSYGRVNEGDATRGGE